MTINRTALAMILCCALLVLAPADVYAQGFNWGIAAAQAIVSWLQIIFSIIAVLAVLAWAIAFVFGKASLGSLAYIAVGILVGGGAVFLVPQLLGIAR